MIDEQNQNQLSPEQYVVSQLQKSKKKIGSRLWHLSEDFMNIVNSLDPNDKDSMQTLSDTMESIGFDETCSDILEFVDELNAVIDGRTKRIKELQEANTADTGLADKLTKTLMAMGLAMGRTTVGDTNRASKIQAGQYGMKILDEDEVPTQFKETKQVITPEKKKALKAAILDGENIPGAEKTEPKPFFRRVKRI